MNSLIKKFCDFDHLRSMKHKGRGMIILTFNTFQNRKWQFWERLKGKKFFHIFKMFQYRWHTILREHRGRGKQQTTIIEFSWLTLIFVQVLLLLAFYCVWGTHFPWVLLKKSIILQQQILVFIHKFGWYLTYVSGKFLVM